MTKKFIYCILLLTTIFSNVQAQNWWKVGNEGLKSDSELKPLPKGSQGPNPAPKIDTALPTIERIKKELVGHSLAEGLSNGYHREDWLWIIEEGQIKSLAITDTIELNEHNFVFKVIMKLSAPYYSYKVKAQIKYTTTTNLSWKFDYVQSLGMNIIVTHEYDTCIKSSIVDDGWGGVDCVQFKNISEMTMAVGGDFLTYNGWQRFSTVIKPHSSSSVGGTFGGGSVSDYRINFIVRIN
ncbi:MAG: hypothetical protein K2J00_07040 [Bacteroidaceae bacterium]|nr:hypothetical protein [Bacteroidaceae bacterium]